MNNLLSIVPALRKRALIFTVQLLVVLATYAASFIARFDFVPSSVPQVQWEMFLQGVPILVLLRMGALWYFNLYRGLWRYVSVFDLVQIAKASASAARHFNFFRFYCRFSRRDRRRFRRHHGAYQSCRIRPFV